jgi:murein DD-endopeptidase MepM/ murein hydrolase activator NlpD
MFEESYAGFSPFQDSASLDPSEIRNPLSPDTITPSQNRYPSALQNDGPAIIAEDRFVDNGYSNFEGDLLNIWDDGTIYAGSRLALNTSSTLPIKRDSNGDPLLGTDNALIPIDDAILLGPDARVRQFSSKRYGQWQPSRTQYPFKAQVPAYEDLLNELLPEAYSIGGDEQVVNINKRWLRTARDWNNVLNTEGSTNEPTVLRVKGGKLTIGRGVDLKNLVLFVEDGGVTFLGRNSKFENVTIVAEGNIHINEKIRLDNVNLFANGHIRLNRRIGLNGDNLLVANKDVLINYPYTSADNAVLNAVATNDIKINAAVDLKGVLLAGDDVVVNRKSTITGSIQAKDDVVFNRRVRFIYEAIDALPLKIRDKQPLVALLDTGISDNPDINPDRLILLRDYVDGDDDPTLVSGEGSDHGTHLAGLIAATQGNQLGIDGINPDAQLAISRVVGSGKWAEALIAVVDYARTSGQSNLIVNLSLDLSQVNPDGSVTTRYEFTPFERLALGYARKYGVLVVAAAGNDGSAMSVLGQASQEFDNLLAVGAADEEGRASYSSYRRGLDLLAYGGTVDNPVISTVGDGLGTMAGTSVAAATVSGTASLIWAENPHLTYKQVINILKQTATDLDTPGWDAETGFGLLNIEAAVELAKVTEAEPLELEGVAAVPTTWGGEGSVIPLERAVWTAAEIGQQPTGGSYATGYIPPFRSAATLTQDWNSAFSHTGNSAFAKDWSIADRKVYAAKGGVVSFVKEDSTRYGNSRAFINDANYVIIRHDDGKESLYVHLAANSVPVNVGDVVEAGTFIGLTGLSGWTTGEHLHFYIRNQNSRQSVPFAFDLTGGGGITPQPPAVNSTGDFTGQIIATTLANIRSGPGTQFADIGDLFFNTTVEFDGWTVGEFIDYTNELGTSSDIWYRIKGQDAWVSAALVNGQPPQSQVPAGSIEFMGKYWVLVPYVIQPGDTLSDIAFRTMGNGSEPYYNFIASRNGIPDPNVISAGATILVPQEVASGTTFNPANNFQSVYEQYKGTLGQAVSDVITHSSGAQYQLFENGSIVSSADGTFPLYGGIRQEYLGTGGLNGWLGAPTSPEVGQGNGVIKQTFENGYIIWNGYNATAYEVGTGVPVIIDPTPPISVVPTPIAPPESDKTFSIDQTLRFEVDDASLYNIQGPGTGFDLDAQLTFGGSQSWDLPFGMKVGLDASLDAGIYVFFSLGTVDLGLSGDFQVSSVTEAETGTTELSINLSNLNPYLPYLSTYLGFGAGLNFGTEISAKVENIPFYGNISAGISNGFELTAEDLALKAIEALLAPGSQLSSILSVDLGFNLNTNAWASNTLSADDEAGLKLDLGEYIKAFGGGGIPDFLSVGIGIEAIQNSTATLNGFRFDPDNISGNGNEFVVGLGESDTRILAYSPNSLRVQPEISLETKFSVAATGTAELGVQGVIEDAFSGQSFATDIVGTILGGLPPRIEFSREREIPLPFFDISTNPFKNMDSWQSISLV